ncbi:uncharacterized protein LOC134632891 [Pelmatolapia mariae]|uniref:uncharacterized protein LOC134632891 n=1 Tax=Pelmatolapia mariae TaxID=158779 RepID=UPI002FE6AFAF
MPPHSLALPPRRGAEAPSFSVPAVTAKRRQGSRHHSSSHSEQQLPVPVPAPRARAAETQPVPAPVPAPQVGTAKVRPILPPVAVPRDRRPSPQLELQPQHPEPAEGSTSPQPEVPTPAGPALSPPEGYAKPRRQ